MKKRLTNQISGISLLVALLISNACNYYKPVSSSSGSSTKQKAEQITALSERVLILRSSLGDFLLNGVNVDMEKEELSGVLSVLPEEHTTYVNDPEGKYSYKPGDSRVTSEVHLFADLGSDVSLGKTLILPISKISKIEVIERDKGRSSGNTILAISAVTVGTIAVIAIISSVSGDDDASPPANPNDPSSSCPYISVHDGEDYVLQGETFGGSIFPSLAREDYIHLSAASIGSEVSVLISNELKEHQFIDMADLVVVEHGDSDKILLDNQGIFKRVKGEVLPKNAILNQGIDVQKKITSSDNTTCSFNDISNLSSINELVVQFDNPGKGKNLSVFLNMKNSQWFEYLFAEFSSKYGDRYTDWVNLQKSKSPDKLIEWQESQQMPLQISVKTANGWAEVTKHNFVGPLMNREVLVSLDGFELEGPVVELAFKTGFLFWEIDQIALMEVENVSKNLIQTIKPFQAKDESERNVLKELADLDGIYLEQPSIGNKAYIKYQIADFSKGKSYSTFLHTKGYYEPIREYQGPADRKFLSKFNKEGAFSDFSRRRYLEASQFARSGLNY